MRKKQAKAALAQKISQSGDGVSYSAVINYIPYKGGKLVPREQLIIKAKPEIEGFSYENRMFNLLVFGANIEELIAEVIADLQFCWDAYALEEDKNLSRGALFTKHFLLMSFEHKKKR